MKKVLVVDDYPLGRDSLETVLTAFGFEVLAASNGLEALEIAKNKKLDCAVIDWMLKGEMNGVEVANNLNLLQPNTRIVIISGRPDINLQQPDATPYSFLKKPFHVPELLGLLKTIDGPPDAS